MGRETPVVKDNEKLVTGNWKWREVFFVHSYGNCPTFWLWHTKMRTLFACKREGCVLQLMILLALLTLVIVAMLHKFHVYHRE